MCALAYVLWLERLDQRVAVETQAALLLRAAGHQVDIPTATEARQRFDRLLSAPPARSHPGGTRAEILQEAFGLTTGGGG